MGEVSPAAVLPREVNMIESPEPNKIQENSRESDMRVPLRRRTAPFNHDQGSNKGNSRILVMTS
jgi:hypothetical protein